MKARHLIVLGLISTTGLLLAGVPSCIMQSRMRYYREAIDTSLRGLKDPNSSVRSGSAKTLSMAFGEDLRVVVPALAEALRDEEPDVRRRAIFALCSIGPGADAAVLALTELLDCPEDHNERSEAARALGWVGPPAATAIPSLLTMFGESQNDGYARLCAAQALGGIGDGREEVVSALIEALGDEDECVRRAAALSLGQIEPPPERAVPALAKALTDLGSETRERAAKALGRLGPRAKAAVPELTEALNGSNKYLREHVAEALMKIAPEEALKLGLRYR